MKKSLGPHPKAYVIILFTCHISGQYLRGALLGDRHDGVGEIQIISAAILSTAVALLINIPVNRYLDKRQATLVNKAQ